MDRTSLLAWIDAYESVWRSPGTERLAELFTVDVTYLPEPYAEPIRGLDALASFWEHGRDGPDEVFTMRREVLAIDGNVGVARVWVAYGDPVDQEYRDLWVVEIDATGVCKHFEEWPFWPGHGRSPGTAAAAGDEAT